MPSFDVVSKINEHELSNAVDQANRMIETRFDFKGTGARFALSEMTITLTAQNPFQLKQMIDILGERLASRGIDVRAMEEKEPEIATNEARQHVIIRQGIDSELAKSITKLIKGQKTKVQAAVQGEQVRITGKKRDDLQTTIALLKDQNYNLPLQFENFRD